MSAPSMIVFPSTGEKVTRSLILRNTTWKDVIVKLNLPDPKAVQMEGTVVLVQARKYAVIKMVFDQSYTKSTQEMTVFLRPVELHNHNVLKEWIKLNKEGPRELVAKIKLKVENSFSASDTILDLPGKACMVEPATTAVTGIDDRDTRTCQAIDNDTATCARMNAEEIGMCNKTEKQEKCWLFGPLVDMVFPPAAGAVSDINHEQNWNPCAGAA